MKRSKFLGLLLGGALLPFTKISPKEKESDKWIEYVARLNDVKLVNVKDKRLLYVDWQSSSHHDDGTYFWVEHPAVFHSCRYDDKLGVHYLEIRVIHPEKACVDKSGIVRFAMWPDLMDRHGYRNAWR
jgi:hypothetical protein